MEFLAEENIYHGALAARNILLSDCFVAKISDFGLSKRLYDKIFTVYQDDDQTLSLPIKWLALETLQNQKMSTKCDIWSFGVLAWEIWEFGAEPYGTCKNIFVLSTIKKQFRHFSSFLVIFHHFSSSLLFRLPNNLN